jgi:uncharacterized protein YjiS (DUF1127 family)
MERATVEQPRSSVDRAPSIAILHHYWTVFTIWRCKRRAIAALLSWNDRMLSDIGIGRSEIEFLVSNKALDKCDRRRSIS